MHEKGITDPAVIDGVKLWDEILKEKHLNMFISYTILRLRPPVESEKKTPSAT